MFAIDYEWMLMTVTLAITDPVAIKGEHRCSISPHALAVEIIANMFHMRKNCHQIRMSQL